MANINTVTLTGNVTRDIELKTTTSGMNIANFSIAVSGYKEDDTSFIDVVAFNKTAEVAAKYLAKGSHVAISGRLNQRSWEAKDGTKRYQTEVIIDNLELPPKGDAPKAHKEVVLEDIEDKKIDISEMHIPF